MKKIHLAAALALALFAESAAAIANIDGPTCYKVSAHKCAITFNFISASDPSLVFLRLSVDSKVVAQSTAWFTTSVAVPGDRYGAGFPVACGALGESGNAAMGLSHMLKFEPLDGSSNSLGLNTANVFCPAK